MGNMKRVVVLGCLVAFGCGDGVESKEPIERPDVKEAGQADAKADMAEPDDELTRSRCWDDCIEVANAAAFCSSSAPSYLVCERCDGDEWETEAGRSRRQIACLMALEDECEARPSFNWPCAD